MIAAFSGLFAWIKSEYSASKRVPELIKELERQPLGFDLGWSGRRLETITSEIRGYGDVATPYLIEALNSSTAYRRDLIIKELVATKDPRAVQPLIEQLQSSDSWVTREAAAEGLGNLGDRRAVQPLLDYVCFDKRGNHWSEITALGKIGDQRAVHQLRLLLDDNDAARRAFASEALGRLGDVTTIGDLTRALNRESDTWVRKMMSVALDRLKGQGLSK